MAEQTHTEQEDFPWIIAVVDHPPRTDSPAFRASRSLMNKLVSTLGDWTFAPAPYQDHHGGGLWVLDGVGWLCVQTNLGIEWSAQFCADPAKVDRLRLLAQRVLAAFPLTIGGYKSNGYDAAADLLATEIVDATSVAAWADSIFNASVPLPAAAHTGTLLSGAGYHHYPKPIVDIAHFKYDDFNLFVADSQGLPAVVVPVAQRNSGDGRVRLLAAHPNSGYAQLLLRATETTDYVEAPDGIDLTDTDYAPADQPEGQSPVLDADDQLARQAFADQP